VSVLRKWFGPSRDEVWRQLSTEIQGRYVDGGFWTGDKVEATHGEWTLTLDTYHVHTGKVVIVFTRMRAPYVNPGAFRFTIYRKSVFSGLGKIFGMQDIEVGDPAFDHDFIIKGTDEAVVRRLFRNARLRQLLSEQPEVKLRVKDDEGYFGPSFPEGVDELEFAVTGVIKDVARLKQVYELFAETLDELCRMGAAYERDPRVQL